MRDLDDMKDKLKSDVFMLYCERDIPAEPAQTNVVDIRHIKTELEKQNLKWCDFNIAFTPTKTKFFKYKKESRFIVVFCYNVSA